MPNFAKNTLNGVIVQPERESPSESIKIAKKGILNKLFNPPLSPIEILDHVCKILSLDKKLLIGDARKPCEHCGCKMKIKIHNSPKYVDARQIICYMIRQVGNKVIPETQRNKGDYSYQAIAKLLGRTLANGKGDHAFAIYSEHNCKSLLQNGDKKFTEKFNKCQLNG